MRNLKRALSLTLASVMLLGMMVLGTSAASYPDVTEEHNVEAIEVLQAVGVMSGSNSGNFNPDSQVSRIEMAIVMSNLMNLKVDYFEDQCKFTDVPAWAGKYVAACEANGIVSGVGGGRYGTGNVTATQAALMMLKALGYFQYASDFEGGWDRQTAKIAADLSLFKGMDVGANTELTRNQVAQLALNTLKTPVVRAEDNTLHITTTVGGANTTVTSGKVNYVVTASTEPYAYAVIDDVFADNDTLNGIAGCVVELGEKLYDGKLQLNDSVGVYDDFGRPARKWQYDGKDFGTYPKKEQLRKEYTKKVTGKDLYDLLGSDIVSAIEGTNRGDRWGLEVTIDGETAKTVLDNVWEGTYFSIASIKRYNTDAVGKTDNGTLTQVYVDSINHQVDIAIINTFLAIAEQDYNAKDDDVDLKVYRIDESGSNTNRYVKSNKAAKSEKIIAAKGEDFNIVDVKDGDKFLVTVAKGEIQSLVAPEIVSETTINSFKEGSWVKNNDAQYDYAATAQYDDDVLDEYDVTNMKNVTYNVILDKYGYLVGLELNEELNQYLFLTGIDLGNSNLSYKNASANVIFADGTMSTVTVNVADSEYAAKPTDPVKGYTITGGGEDLNAILNHVPAQTKNAGGEFKSYSRVNTWCTYSVDSNNVYTLKQVGTYSIARTDDPAVKGAKKIAQSAFDVDTVALSGDRKADQLVINNKNTALPGSKHLNASVFPGVANNDNDYTWVYGNNETVYINASLKGVESTDDGQSAIVNKVESVVTGIANVDFTVKNIAYATTGTDYNNAEVPKEEIYTLYNDKGYAIAVVMLGADDNGSTSRFVYVTKATNQEDYTGSDTWVWHANGILDGVKGELTEARNTRKYLDKLVAGNWYSVTYDKDGHVNGLRTEDTTPGTQSHINFAGPTTDRFITSVADIEDALNGGGTFSGTSGKTLLLQADYTCGAGDLTHTAGGTNTAKLHVEGNTLYVTPDTTTGLRINDDTKIVLILSKNHGISKRFDVITDDYKGQSGLRKALNDLGTLMTVENGNKVYVFDGILNAVISSNGYATSIILEDHSGNGHPAITENIRAMKVKISLVRNDTGTQFGTLEDWITADKTYTTTDINNCLADYGLEDVLEATGTKSITYDEGAAHGDGKAITFTYKRKTAAPETTKEFTVQYKAEGQLVDMGKATLDLDTMMTNQAISDAVTGATLDLVNDYEIVSPSSRQGIDANAGPIVINVKWRDSTVKLADDAPAGTSLTLSWDEDNDAGYASGNKTLAVGGSTSATVPHGAKLAISGTSAGKYTSTGVALTTEAGKLTAGAAGATVTIANTAYGYYKVTVVEAVTTTGVTNVASATASIEGGFGLVKVQTDEVTVKISVTANDTVGGAAANLKAKAVDNAASSQVTVNPSSGTVIGNSAIAAEGTEDGTLTVTLAAAPTRDVEVKITLENA